MPEAVVAVAAAVVTAASAAYSAYAQDAARRNAEKLLKAQLEEIGVKTEAEKKLLEMQVNTADSKFFDQDHSPPAATASATVTDQAGAALATSQPQALASASPPAGVDGSLLLIGGVLAVLVWWKGVRK